MGAMVCFVGFGWNSSRGFAIRVLKDGEVGAWMSGRKRAGGTPLASRDKPALRNGRWGVAGEAAVVLREFL